MNDSSLQNHCTTIIGSVKFEYCVTLVCDIPASSNALQLSGIQLLRFSVLLLLKALQKLLENTRHKRGQTVWFYTFS